MSFISIPLVTVAWLLVGYSLAFSEGSSGGFIGGLAHAGMRGIGPDTVHGAVPELLYATFQLSFAIITAALVSGAIADRAKFAAWMVFVPVWSIVVYSVVAHWVWGPDGWLFKMGVLDYAGGLVVEIVSGSSALALALVLGPRHRIQGGGHAAAQSAVRSSGCRTAVVRLVRLQRRFGSGRQWYWHRRYFSTRWSRDAWACSAGCRSSRSGTESRPPSVRLPASSPAWWPSPRRAAP